MVELLKAHPLNVEEISEAYTSSVSLFNGKKLKKDKRIVEKVDKVFNPYLITGSAHESGGIRVVRMTARYFR